MTQSIRIFLIAISAIILAGCQTADTQGTSGITCTSVGPCNGNMPADGMGSTTNTSSVFNTPTTANIGAPQGNVAIVQKEPIIINATGYAAMMTSKRLSKSQARIMTMRSSMLDAYRNLSERVYGLKIDGASSLSNMVMQNDELRTYVDAYLVGAKVISQREHEDGTFETVVEMALQENFRQCVTSPNGINSNPNCTVQPAYRTMNIENQAPATNFYSIE